MCCLNEQKQASQDRRYLKRNMSCCFQGGALMRLHVLWSQPASVLILALPLTARWLAIMSPTPLLLSYHKHKLEIIKYLLPQVAVIEMGMGMIVLMFLTHSFHLLPLAFHPCTSFLLPLTSDFLNLILYPLYRSPAQHVSPSSNLCPGPSISHSSVSPPALSPESKYREEVYW